ncbi:MAG TPA: patatin-like phospholipase family protein [Xanthobacteraceae bacterium]|jgi:NTE family protein|nr:patatin-like phospholipase family protein [Xanthobacteraceae bacterium]
MKQREAVESEAPARPACYDKKVALVLQGGGALGSYQAGVYEALSTSEYVPDWVAGISIGAINAAIIAGNAPETRIERLRAFWEGITTPWPWAVWSGALSDGHRRASSLSALVFGQPGLFAPRSPTHWMFGSTPASYYETCALKDTLERLIDFDRINGDELRLSVGAVNLRTGDFAYFDNTRTTIRAEHVMASAALPPGFPPVEIDGECYWDGGLVSNTPLQYVLECIPRRSRLTFQVDLFNARGIRPANLDEVGEREKDIRYASKTRATTELFRMIHDVRHNYNNLWDRLPEELRNTTEAKFLYEFGCVTTMDIVELIYRPSGPQGAAKDYEFSRATMRTRWEQGRSDATAALRASPWLAPMPPEVGARTFDVLGECSGE